MEQKKKKKFECIEIRDIQRGKTKIRCSQVSIEKSFIIYIYFCFIITSYRYRANIILSNVLH